MSSELRAKITNVLFEFVTRLTPDEAAEKGGNIIDKPYATIDALRERVKRLQAEVRAYRDRLEWAEIGAADNSSDEARATTMRTIQDHIDARAAVDAHKDLEERGG